MSKLVFFDRFQLGKSKSQGRANLAAKYDLGTKMYLVRHMRGTASELGLSRLSKQSDDVKNDDVTSGSMVPDFNVGKIQLLTEKS